MDKISVIIPVYNVEGYLKECLDSIINQTYDNLQIIIIDDGSNDNSGIICDEYAKIDSRITVIHQDNGGLSDARNTGLDLAIGEYISFVDSDDFISCDYFEFLLNNLIKYDSDISCCAAYKYHSKDNYKSSYVNEVKKMTNNEAIFHLIIEDSYCSHAAWAKLYKRQLFNKIRFPKGKIHEDLIVVPRLVGDSKSVIYNGQPKYFFRMREGSITRSGFSKKSLDQVFGYELLQEYITNHFPELLKYSKTKLLNSYFAFLGLIYINKKEKEFNIERKAIINKIKENKFWDKDLNIKQRLSIIIVEFNPKLFGLFYRFRKKKLW